MSTDSAEFEFELGERQVEFALSESIYPRDAVYGAAYHFIDRCFVFLTRPGDDLVGVRLRTKTPQDEEALEALAGEFANELLNQLLRHRVGESTKTIREYYMARAFYTDAATSTIDALLAELDAEELEDDPLEIEVPWEKEGADG